VHNSFEKASKDTQTLYTTKSLREAKKNIIASVDHILQHDLVQETTIAAEFVNTMVKNAEHKRTVQHQNAGISGIKERQRQ
jgi:hypothetical protein